MHTNQKKVINIKTRNNPTQEVDTRAITSLMNNILVKRERNNLNNPRLKAIHLKLDFILDNFNRSYKELVRTEIKAMNLNIAAEAIKDRDDLVDGIYQTVMQEINEQICQ